MKKLHRDTNYETITATVTGHVQGVGYRASAVRQAHALGVRGWIRNQPDGSVQALLQGPHDQVDRMLSWLHAGPPAARVGQVVHHETPTDRYYDRFEQI